jgi:dATP/dGTP diphosphohydrolase, N-terminal
MRTKAKHLTKHLEAKWKEVKDSGKRQHFKTGSVRDTDKGKGRFDLIPPYVLARLAQHYENGAAKYTDRNWEKGQPLTRYIDSTLRHITKWLLGDDNEDHLTAAIWNLFAVVNTEREIKEGKLPKELLENLNKERLEKY